MIKDNGGSYIAGGFNKATVNIKPHVGVTPGARA
jgi:hypothetical protein